MKRISLCLVPFCFVASAFCGVKNYPLPFASDRTITTEASVLRTTEAAETAIDSVFATSWTVTMGATNVARSLFGYITSDGSATGLGHYVGVFGRADVPTTGQQFAIGIEGYALSKSQYATGDVRGAVGHAIWDSAASTGTTAMIVGMQALAEVFNGDGATARSTGTTVGIYIDPNVGGATKYGLFQAGPNDTNYYAGPVQLSSGIYVTGGYRSGVQLLTVADSGGAGAASGTLTPTSDYALITCSDADGCNVTVSETGAADGKVLTIVGGSANTSTIADSSGVTEIAGSVTLGIYDTISLRYVANAWAEMCRSNN